MRILAFTSHASVFSMRHARIRACYRADSRSASSQWETALLCNDVSHCLGANLEPCDANTCDASACDAMRMRAFVCDTSTCERICIACERLRGECAHLRGTYACPVLYWLGAHEVTNHYLNQWWLIRWCMNTLWHDDTLVWLPILPFCCIRPSRILMSSKYMCML